MRSKRISVKDFDWTLLAPTLGLATMGLLSLYSSTQGRGVSSMEGLYIKQLWWLALGGLSMSVVMRIDYRTLGRYAYIFYGVTVLSLAYILVHGKIVSGAQRWIDLGPINLQPSEISKLIIVLALARCLQEKSRNGPMGFKNLLLPAGLVLLPFLLIVKQPDLGTALLLLLLALVMAFLGGMKRRTLLIILIFAVASSVLLWQFMEDYQRARVLTLLHPNADTRGAGYQSLQSKIAVGSGGLVGKGLMAGTQSGLNFLPEKHTDFIFAVVAEEMGFIGSLVVLFLYLAIITKGLNIALRARDALGGLMAAGVVTMLSLHVVLNIAMTVGMAPVVGIPLPILSYGGSSMVTNLTGIGLLLNIKMRSKTLPVDPGETLFL